MADSFHIHKMTDTERLIMSGKSVLSGVCVVRAFNTNERMENVKLLFCFVIECSFQQSSTVSSVSHRLIVVVSGAACDGQIQ